MLMMGWVAVLGAGGGVQAHSWTTSWYCLSCCDEIHVKEPHHLTPQKCADQWPYYILGAV